MEKSANKKRILWAIGASVALTVCFVLCRYVFFAFHGNRQWSVFLLIIGFVALGIAIIFDSRKTMALRACSKSI